MSYREPGSFNKEKSHLKMNCGDEHHFRFRLRYVLLSTFLLAFLPPTLALSMPNGCQEVAVYGMNWNPDPIKEDFQFVRIFTDCVRNLYRLYNQTDDWSLVDKVISPEVRNVVRLIRELSFESPTFDGIQLLFVSAYFFETIELYDRAMNLEVKYKLHQEELELLRTKKIEPLANSISSEIVLLLENITLSKTFWGRSGACYSLDKIKKKSIDLIDELHNIIAELRGMVVAYRDTRKFSTVSMKSEVNYKLHQEELELLRTKKIQPLADSISSEIVLLLENITLSKTFWGRWGACYTLDEIKERSIDLIDELHNIIAELRGMARITYRDTRKFLTVSGPTLTFAIGSFCVGLLITLCFGWRRREPRLKKSWESSRYEEQREEPTFGVSVNTVLSSVVVAVIVGCYWHFSDDVKTILNNLDTLCKEIHKYRRFVHGGPPN